MNRPSRSKTPLLTAGLLAGFAIIGVGLVTGTHLATKNQILENERNRLMLNVAKVLDPNRYDNDPVSDFMDLIDPELLAPNANHSGSGTRVYRAFKDGKPVAVVFPIVAPDGYNGAIRLLMAIHYDGAVSGVRVLNHKETPGLGDVIEVSKSEWITGFTGKTLDTPNAAGWKVKKDGGVFDQFTGATITPRAIVTAVHRGLRLFQKHRMTLFPKTSPHS